MFPGQQGATCPAQIWPPRLGIKLLEGATSTEKRALIKISDGITKNRCSQPSFCTVGGKRQSGHINPATPVVQRGGRTAFKGLVDVLADFCIFIARHYLFREELPRAQHQIFWSSR